MNTSKLSIPLLIALAFSSAQAVASPVLGSELAEFSVLGASTVTNTGVTSITGNLGVAPGSAITGKASITLNGTNAASIGNLSLHEADATSVLAQGQLFSAMTNLGLMGPGTLKSADLGGLTLTPGVYTVAAGISNLTGTLTLDGLGNTNAFWVFQMPSTLITSPGSIVNVINTGAGAGVFWNVGSSATLNTNTSFEGNILAFTSISLNTGATIGCGRALANNGAVTMDTNTVSSGCSGALAGSHGLSEGLTVPLGGGAPTPLALSTVPEPGTYLLFGAGLVGMLSLRKRQSLRRN